MNRNNVILVNSSDEEVGVMDKMDAHTSGSLHRAFSVFIFNSKGEMLIHRRAENKYHSGGLWTNACCSHPIPGEKLENAVERRLKEEIGLSCKTAYLFNFTYREKLENDLIEHELDHVFFGITDDVPNANPDEVSEVKYIASDDLISDLEQYPERYTVWFRMIAEKVIDRVKVELER